MEAISIGRYRHALEERFDVAVFDSAASFQRARSENEAKGGSPALLIADPAVVGGLQEMLRAKAFSRQPCIVISSDNSLTAIEKCFDAGAEDYLLKPIDPHLLVAKVKRRLASSCARQFNRTSGLELDYVSRTARYAEKFANFTPREFQILDILASAYPEGVSRQTLFQRIWGNVSVGAKALDVHLFMARKKLEELGFEIRCEVKATYFLVRK